MPLIRQTQIGIAFAQDVAQAGRAALAQRHGEGQPVCLARAVIRVLPQDHRPHRTGRGVRQGGEALRGGRVDHPAGSVLGGQEMLQPVQRGIQCRIGLQRAAAQAAGKAGSICGGTMGG